MILAESKIHFVFEGNVEIFQRLAERHVYFSFEANKFPPDGVSVMCSKAHHPEPFVCFIGKPFIAGFGFASYSNSIFDYKLQVGRYCSLADGIRIMADSHPLNRITTHTITYQKFASIHIEPSKTLGGSDMTPIPFAQKPMPTIEHDVWIGSDVILARGITLGTGCVVAASSVVTKDVPPYAIVGGNPAKLIRFRFEEEIIGEMLRLRWWRFAYPHFAELPFDKPATFLQKLEQKIEAGLILEYDPDRIDVYKMLKEDFGL